MSEWISVESCRPQIGGLRLFYSPSAGIFIGEYHIENGFYVAFVDEHHDREPVFYNDITHWMPLPEPPHEP